VVRRRSMSDGGDDDGGLRINNIKQVLSFDDIERVRAGGLARR